MALDKAIKDMVEQLKRTGEDGGDLDQFNEKIAQSSDILNKLAAAAGDDARARRDANAAIERENKLLQEQNDIKEQQLDGLKRDIELSKRGAEVMLNRIRILKDSNEAEDGQIESMEASYAAMMKQIKAYERVSESADIMGNMIGISSDLSGNAVGRLVQSSMGLKSVFKDLSGPDGMSLLKKQFTSKAFAMNVAASAATGLLQVTAAYIGFLVKMAKQLDEVAATFAKSTGTGRKFQAQINDSAMDLYAFGLGMEEAGAAMGALTNTFSGFNRMGTETQNSLAVTVAKFDAMGVAADQSVAFLTMSTKALGMTEKQAESTMLKISMMGTAIGAGPAEIMREYTSAMPYLTQFGNRAEEVFIGMKGMAEATGVSFESLLAMTQKMDTFTGAADVASQMNALMGMQLSTSELLMASNEERLDMMHSEFQATGRSFKQMGRFEQQLMANAAGFQNVAEAAQFFDSSMGEVAANRLEMRRTQATQEDFNDALSKATPMMQKLKTAFMKMFVSASPMLDAFTSIVDKITEFFNNMDEGTQHVIMYTVLLGGLAGIVITLATVFSALGVTLGAALVLFGKIALAIGAIAAAAFALIKVFPKLGQAIGIIPKASAARASPSFNDIMETMPQQFEETSVQAKKAANSISATGGSMSSTTRTVNNVTNVNGNNGGDRPAKIDLAIDFGKNRIFRDTIMSVLYAEDS